MITDPELLKSLLHQGALMPQEEMLEIAKSSEHPRAMEVYPLTSPKNYNTR